MADNSSAETVSKFGIGVLVGGALYFLIRNLGFGGFGFGGSGGSDEGHVSPSSPSSPPIPRDEQRLEFLMIAPTTVGDKNTAFRGPGAKIYSLEEMIARIKAGGRTDVTLKFRGDVITGPAVLAETRIKSAGVDIWKAAPPPLFPEKQPTGPAVSGNARGCYGARPFVGRGMIR